MNNQEISLIDNEKENIPGTNFGLGFLHSPVNPNTMKLEDLHEAGLARSAIASSLPKSVDLRKQMPPVINQGSRGTCVSCCASYIKGYQEKKDCKYNGTFSVNYVYYYRKNNPTYGMYLDDAMNILQTKGCCTDETFPYTNYEPKKVPKNADKEASNYKVKYFVEIASIQGVKKFLHSNGPCMISFPVYNGTSSFWKKRKGEKIQGGHAVTIVGYDDNNKRFILQNSWGTSWGNKGFTYFPYDEFNYKYNIFGCIDLKGSPLPDNTENEKRKKKEEEERKKREEKERKKKEEEWKKNKKKDKGCFTKITDTTVNIIKKPIKLIKKILPF